MIDQILELARGEIGHREYPTGSNHVKYNTEYYGRAVSGSKFPWCCVFLWWLFRKARCPELFFNGKKTAYCPALLTYHSKMGQRVDGDYRPGDIVFYNFTGGSQAQHVGLCESFDGTWMVSIEGNTGAGQDANGGAVLRRRRPTKYIVGVIRPAYPADDPEQEKIEAVVREMEKARQEREPDPSWGAEARSWVLEKGLFVGDREGRLQWEAPVTRNQLATVLYKLFGKM